MIRVETFGSIWLIDEDQKRYCRMPKEEGPRQSPEGKDWGGPSAGKLQDLVWHDYVSWEIVSGFYLVIRFEPEVEDGPCLVRAPGATVEGYV